MAALNEPDPALRLGFQCPSERAWQPPGLRDDDHLVELPLVHTLI